MSDPGKNSSAKDVFLSHSGKQKNFVRQLYRDLTNQGVSCFFDQDNEGLPVGEEFPPHIFEATKTCKVALLLLSVEFLESKWPMKELSAFVEAKYGSRTNPNLKILPLFFKISPDDLKNITADNAKWTELENSEEKRGKWEKALKAVRRIKGLNFTEGGDEVKFRDDVATQIWQILPTPSPRYHVHRMQGEERMCQEVAHFINSVQPNEKLIRIGGLYGIAGRGKTTLGKAFCNFKLGEFEGKVCHLDLSRGDSFERVKHALHYLTHCPQSHLQTLTDKDQAQIELYRRVKCQRVLLVLDNITEESIDEVKYYLEAELGVDSCVILSGRCVDVLVKHFRIDGQSCMGVPELKEEEAIRILLESMFLQESTLTAEERAFAVRCAQRCSFKDIGPKDRTFHPLALKALRSHLSSKYGSNLSAWVDKTEGLVNRSGYGLDDLLAFLGKAFNNMSPANRTIFMLLALYMPPNTSPHKVNEWLAMILNEEISSIETAVGDLYRNAFIEESEPKILIHDLYVEFAQSKANEMRRWLWWKGKPCSRRQLISNDVAGFELARLEQCIHARLTQIDPGELQNLLVLQLVDVRNMSKLDLGRMGHLRSITVHNCKDLKELKGMEKLQWLAWLQISEVNPMFRFPKLGTIKGLQYLEIKFAGSQVLNQRVDLSSCVFLREITVCCRSLWEFPRLKGLRHLKKVEFSVSDKVNVPFDSTECVELQSTVIQSDRSGWNSKYKKLSKTVLWDSDAVKAFPDIDVSSALEACSHITDHVEVESFVPLYVISALKILESCDCLENLQLWNFRHVEKLLNFRLLSNLTVLKLGKCGILEPLDLSSCVFLEDICFATLENLRRFPNFSALKKLKILRLYNCWRVEDPPDITECNELQVFHLVYNDTMKQLPDMGVFPRLEEIKLSWESDEVEVICGTAENDLPYQDVKFVLEHFTEDETFCSLSDVSAPKALREWEWLRGKSIQGIRYVRKGKKYNSITAPYQSHKQSQLSGKGTVVERVKIHPFWYSLSFTILFANIIIIADFFPWSSSVCRRFAIFSSVIMLLFFMIIFRTLRGVVLRLYASHF